MAKLFLLSIIIALLSLPARAARMPNARVGLKTAFIHVAAFFALYLVGLLYIFGKSGATHAVYMLIIVLVYRFVPRLQITERKGGERG